MTATDSTHSIYTSVDHLFRHRAGQMVASLTRIFGLDLRLIFERNRKEES